MRRDSFLNACVACGLLACAPNSLIGDGDVGSPALLIPGEQPGLRLHPAPVLTEGFEQSGAQRHIAVASTFTVPDVDYVAGAVDVADFQRANLRPSHACAWRITKLPEWRDFEVLIRLPGMRDSLILFVHLIVTVVRLAGPGGLRSVVAESALVRHQLLILNRGRK